MDIHDTLREYTSDITVCDPWAEASIVESRYGIHTIGRLSDEHKGHFDAIILGVAHREFLNIDIRSYLRDPQKGVVYDVKGVLGREQIDGRL